MKAQLPAWAVLGLHIAIVNCWTDSKTKWAPKIFKDGPRFTSNFTSNESFILLDQDNHSITLGARNAVYNLNVTDLAENRDKRIEWPSSGAHRELCNLKGKSESDCQNYVRILAHLGPDEVLTCGTNSFKPLCRNYKWEEGKYVAGEEKQGHGMCPYDPNHNSTAIFENGQLFSATVADFSGEDSLIYRQPLRTQTANLKQLNDPDFVSSISYRDYVMFFFRETAVEFINCGKAIYSRVARVCKDDKGGSGSLDGWTSFLKARLNCSVPGEFPFYFDEIQATSGIVSGVYDEQGTADELVYATFSTPQNAIWGSAVCAFSMRDVLAAFDGSFKSQENINANWLPVQPKVPEPRPGQCVSDSRTLPDYATKFVKSHSLMETAVPSYFGRPILTKVNQQYRLTAVAVEPQVLSIGRTYDVVYVGTSDGRVLKVVNVVNANRVPSSVVSTEFVVFNGTPISELRVTQEPGQVVVVTKAQVRLLNTVACESFKTCNACISAQDPHCAWSLQKAACVVAAANLLQDVQWGNGKLLCGGNDEKEIKPSSRAAPKVPEYRNVESTIIDAEVRENEVDDVSGAGDVPAKVPVRELAGLYTARTLHVSVLLASLMSIIAGFSVGYCLSRRFHNRPQFVDSPFIEQHNRLNRLSNAGCSTNGANFRQPLTNKTINLVVNVPTSKRDNLETNKDLNISSEGTLQKIKKTYI